MSLLSIDRVSVGSVDIGPGEVRIISTDNLATVITPGYINQNNAAVQLTQIDIVKMIYAYDTNTKTGTFNYFTVTINNNGIITLAQSINPSDVLLPVTNGDFAVFNGITGQIKDLGYLPSNASKTRVVMANAATTANYAAAFVDITGTIAANPARIINPQGYQAGLPSGTGAGYLTYSSVSSSGSMTYFAQANAGNFSNGLSNQGTQQATNWILPDPGVASTYVATNNAGYTNTATLTLNAAGVIAMYATPALIVPAITGYGIYVTSVQANYIGGSAAFTGGGIIVVQYGNSAHGAGATATAGASIAGAGLLTGGTSNLYVAVTGINNSASGTGTASSGLTGAGIYISNQTNPFAVGTGASLVITVSYVQVPLL